MNPSWRQYASLPTPDYETYPSVSRFDGQVSAAEHAEALSKIDVYEPLAIFINLPFRKSHGGISNHASVIGNDYRDVMRYVRALLAEIRTVGRLLAGKGRPVAVHFGGLSSNFLLAEELAEILDAIETELSLTDDARLSIELDPSTIGYEDIAGIIDLGFNCMRFCIPHFGEKSGNRDMQDIAVLDENAVFVIKSCLTDLAIDIPYGFPRQTKDRLLEMASYVTALGPDRISLRRYIVHENEINNSTPINSGGADAYLLSEMAESADQLITGSGYEYFGPDQYIKSASLYAADAAYLHIPGRRKNPAGALTQSTIAFGAAAVSFVNGRYAQNALNVEAYRAAVNVGKLATQRGYVRTTRDECLARAISSLLAGRRTDLRSVLNQLARTEAHVVQDSINHLEACGVISVSDEGCRVNKAARFLSRAAASVIDPYASARIGELMM